MSDKHIQLIGRGLFAVLLLTALSTAAPDLMGQRWRAPYQEGVKAVEQGLRSGAPPGDPVWQRAVEQLEEAIRRDPEAGLRKTRIGTFWRSYFPYYYLGIALLKNGELQKSEEAFEKARSFGEVTQMADLSAQLDGYERELADLIADASQVEPSAFEVTVEQAQAALADSRFRDAISLFNEAEDLSRSDFSEKNLDRQRQQARQGLWNRLVDEARRLANDGRLEEAKQRFLEAEGILPGQQQVSTELAEIQSRLGSYGESIRQAEQAANRQEWQRAIDLYSRAQEADPRQANQDGLSSRIDELHSKLGVAEASNACTNAYREGAFADAARLCGQLSTPQGRNFKRLAESRLVFQQALDHESSRDYEQAEPLYKRAVDLDESYDQASRALKRLRDYRQVISSVRDRSSSTARPDSLKEALADLSRAQSIDSGRFAADLEAQRLQEAIQRRLNVVGPDPEDPPEPPDEKSLLKQALAAVYQGRAAEARQSLESAWQGGLDNAHLHAMLGIAYASLAFESGDSKAFRKLRLDAIASFRKAREKDPDYALPQNLFSPLLVQLFNQAKNESPE